MAYLVWTARPAYVKLLVELYHIYIFATSNAYAEMPRQGIPSDDLLAGPVELVNISTAEQ